MELTILGILVYFAMLWDIRRSLIRIEALQRQIGADIVNELRRL